MFCDYCGCEILVDWDEPTQVDPGIIICLGCREEMDREMAQGFNPEEAAIEAAFEAAAEAEVSIWIKGNRIRSLGPFARAKHGRWQESENE